MKNKQKYSHKILKNGVQVFDVIGTLREKDDTEAIALVNEINGEIV